MSFFSKFAFSGLLSVVYVFVVVGLQVCLLLVRVSPVHSRQTISFLIDYVISLPVSSSLPNLIPRVSLLCRQEKGEESPWERCCPFLFADSSGLIVFHLSQSFESCFFQTNFVYSSGIWKIFSQSLMQNKLFSVWN